MTPEQENHLRDIKYDFLKAVDEKYRKGQAEHGGDLWKKPGVLEMLMEECIDFYVYAHVLRQQRDNPEVVDPTLKDNVKDEIALGPACKVEDPDCEACQ
jgi:hypothetical protein